MNKKVIDDRYRMPNWQGEDLEKAKSCNWMKDVEYRRQKKLPWLEARQNAWWWYKKLCKHLPSDHLYEMREKLKIVSFIFQFKVFDSIIQYHRYHIVNTLLMMEYYKNKMLSEASQERINTRKSPNYEESLSTIEDYRFRKLTSKYPAGSEEDKIQRNEIIPGYKPTHKILMTQKPIEILEYCGYKLYKFNKLHGYYSNMIVYPDGRHYIKYADTPYQMEAAMEKEFDNLIEDYLKSNTNPYGDKVISNTNVDISNVMDAMGYNNNQNPLEEDIF